MPTNPNIILSGNQMAAPRLPDVNAMMQTRTAGLENVYNIEQQRAAQAQAAQKEQAAAQEAATLKALLPAYTYGIQTGDIAGAGNLVPPEMRGQLQPYIDALAGKSPEAVKSALIGSLSASPAGQEALAAIQRAQTFGVQSRQQTLAERKFEEELARAGQPEQPKPMSEYEANVIRLREQEAAANAAKNAAVASGEAPPVALQKGETWNPEKQRVEAAPGSELYRKQKAEHVKDYKEAEGTLQRLENVSQVATDLKNTTGWQKAFGTGAIMSRMPNTPLSSVTGAYDFQTKYDNLTGAVKEFGRAVASMQGKLGNMAVQEWKNVADSVAAMDLTKMSGAELDSQLDRIADQINVAKNNIRRAYDLEYNGTQFYEPLSERGAGEVAKTTGGSTVRPAGVGPDWSLEEDAQGNRAWVSPQRDKFIEAQ